MTRNRPQGKNSDLKSVVTIIENNAKNNNKSVHELMSTKLDTQQKNAGNIQTQCIARIHNTDRVKMRRLCEQDKLVMLVQSKMKTLNATG